MRLGWSELDINIQTTFFLESPIISYYHIPDPCIHTLFPPIYRCVMMDRLLADCFLTL
jgi:hypothetical protein